MSGLAATPRFSLLGVRIPPLLAALAPFLRLVILCRLAIRCAHHTNNILHHTSIFPDLISRWLRKYHRLFLACDCNSRALFICCVHHDTSLRFRLSFADRIFSCISFIRQYKSVISVTGNASVTFT